MSGIARITSTEVFDVIEGLLAKGQAPTHLSVRDAIGGRGSGPVLSRYIALWFQDHGPDFGKNVAEGRKKGPFDDLGAQLKLAAAQAAQVISDAEQSRAAALDLRDAELQKREEELRLRETALLDAVERFNDREPQLAHLIAELRADKAALTGQLENADAERRALQQDLQGAIDANAAATAEARSDLHAKLDQIERLNQRPHDLKALHAASVQLADTRAKEITDLSSRLAECTRRVEIAEAKQSHALQLLEDAQKTLQAAHDHNANQTALLASREHVIETLRKDLESARADLVRAGHSAELERREREALTVETAALQRRLDAAEAERLKATALARQLDELGAELCRQRALLENGLANYLTSPKMGL